jgi:hypothetical protein
MKRTQRYVALPAMLLLMLIAVIPVQGAGALQRESSPLSMEREKYIGYTYTNDDPEPIGWKSGGGGVVDENHNIWYSRLYKGDLLMVWLQLFTGRNEKKSPIWLVKDVLVFKLATKSMGFYFKGDAEIYCFYNNEQTFDVAVLYDLNTESKICKAIKAYRPDLETCKFKEIPASSVRLEWEEYSD